MSLVPFPHLGPILAAGVLLPGCALIPGHSFVPPESRPANPRCSAFVPEGYDGGFGYMSIKKANPVWWFMNHDDPEVPGWYKPEDSPFTRELKWHTRNPLHNFTYYVIGIADRPFVRCGRNPDSIWARGGGWNFRTFHAGPFIHLPGVSYKGETWEFYLGWRSHGNFGAAFRPGRNTTLPDDNNPPPK